MRFIPDWLIYIVATILIVVVLFEFDERQRANAPEWQGGGANDEYQIGANLPPPSAYDPEVLVEVGEVSTGLGTAFAISEEGWWITARHVVDSCDQVGIIVSRGAAAP